MTTTTTFNHIDLSSQAAGTVKPWGKVDGGGSSFALAPHQRRVADLREAQKQAASSSADDDDDDDDDSHVFTTDTAGFALIREPASEREFVDDAAVRGPYYDEVEALLRKHLSSSPSPSPPGDANSSSSSNGTVPSKVSRVVIFDHTIRRRLPGSPRSPVQQVHVDQTPEAARARVRRHVPDPAEAERLIRGRFQIINVWRPIENPASDHPLAVIDWRSTRPDDFVPVDLLYPKRAKQQQRADSAVDGVNDDEDDDRGKETLADASADPLDTSAYEVKGETFGVAPAERHRFYYARDMHPDEALLLKCYDSAGEGEPLAGAGGEGEKEKEKKKKKIAPRAPHTAFEDPQTPADAPPRQSIEVRCLVFYE